MDKNLTKLPRALLKTLSEYHLKEQDYIYVALADMNLDCEYADCYVLLSADRLILAGSAPIEKRIKTFGGYGEIPVSEKDDSDWSIKIYPINQIEKLDVIATVSGGILYANILDEADSEKTDVDLPDTDKTVSHQLTAFTNMNMGEFRRICRMFDKVKKGEQLTEADYKDEHRREFCPKCGSMYPDRDRNVCPKCMDRRSIFSRVLSYFKPYSFKIAMMMLCFLGTAALGLVWPYLNGTVLYDQVLGENEQFLTLAGIPAGKFAIGLLLIVITMAGTKLLMQILGIIQGVITAKVVPDVVKDIKSGVFASMGKLSIKFYNNRQTGGLMTRVLDDAEEVTHFFIDGLPFFFTNALTIISTVIVMVGINWKLAIASLFLLPFLTIISYKLLPRLWHLYGKRHRASRNMNSQINDNITGARVVKAFGQEDSELTRFGKYNGSMRTAELNIVGYDNRFTAIYESVKNIAYFIVWGVGSMFVLNKTGMEFGMLITFVSYVAQLNGPLDFMSHIFRWWANSTNAAQRIFEIIDANPDVLESPNPVPLPNPDGGIKLSGVTFGYEPNKPVLQNITMDIEPGEMLGIVGRSGAGKSTLVNLISRLYDPDEGEIYIDGINIRDLSFKDLRRNVAMVSQETYIFMGTVMQNISYANPDATEDDVIAAAAAASAHDFICRMPDGYDTVIGSSGRELSGGERQRVSIARAILANPKILILDEATASVDTETEQAIQESLDRLVKGRTTISIAHRLSTLKNADKLVVLDDGKLTESGTHAELIEKKGTYHMLMELQSKALAMRGLDWGSK